MMLDVRYEEIRSEVIGKLMEQKEQMENELKSLERIVSQIPAYMEGEAAVAYAEEFYEIVMQIYSNVNVNIGDFADQLETVCQEFEKLDADIKTQLS